MKNKFGEGEIGMPPSKWDAATDPVWLLEAVRGMASDEQLRRFICHCGHRHWHLLTQSDTRSLAAIGERLAAGQVSEAERAEAEMLAGDLVRMYGQVDECPEYGAVGLVYAAVMADAFEGARRAVDFACHAAFDQGTAEASGGEEEWNRVAERERAGLCGIIRELFGSPPWK